VNGLHSIRAENSWEICGVMSLLLGGQRRPKDQISRRPRAT
jgi:hypothetical protein